MTPVALSEAPDRIRRLFRRPHPSPVFVLGNQKSGTTAVAALLAASAGRTATLDILYRLGDPAIGERFIRGDTSLAPIVAEFPGDFSRTVIKDPDFTFRVDALREAFPAARYVFVVRDPRDNVRSIFNRLGIPGRTRRSDDPIVRTALETTPAWRGALLGELPPTQRESLAATQAARWQLAVDVYLDDPGRYELIRYEDFRSDKGGSIAALTERLALGRPRDIDHLVNRSFQPPGDNSATWDEFFGDDNLAEIVHEARDGMSALGYS